MVDVTGSSVWGIVDSFTSQDPKKPSEATGTVSSIGDDGTIYVRIDGSTVETPVSGTYSDVKPGDDVKVTVYKGRASIAGNSTSPSVGATYVNETVMPAMAMANDAFDAALVADDGAKRAHVAADEARAMAEATDQHFFADTNGVHVTEAEGDPTTEHNILITSLGILLRHAANYLASVTQSAIAFYDGLDVGTEGLAAHMVASFGSSGAQIGKSGAAHTDIDANGMRIYAGNGTTTVADLGYGASRDAEGQTSNNPYYTLGGRASNSGKGAYSLAQGQSLVASGYCSHAEGLLTEASGDWSHAEGIGDPTDGYTTASGDLAHAEGSVTTASGRGAHSEGDRTTASGDFAHAEGDATTASGGYSHSEGYHTTASGDYSHAEGYRTTAASDNQLVCGVDNVPDTNGTYGLIMGHGDLIGNPKNAFAVRWDGTVDTAQDAYVTSAPATVFSADSGLTVTEALYYRRGQVAMLTITVKATTAKSGSWSVGTVVSGKRPAIMTYGSSSLTAIEAVRLYAGGGASCIGELAQDASVTLAWTYVVA